MKANEIRSRFLDFFKAKEHLIVASEPMVRKNDPTLKFTNAGMNQFKDVFLDNEAAPAKRVADTQKCLRVSGKHNDLEEVGVDTYHHTMFEMLGNWSFGDYFKKEAINWAWELLTEVYKIDKDRLYITIFEGDKADGTARDTEAYDLWKDLISEDRIIDGNKADNFWEMGDTGPAGPCSEIHVDIRSDEERAAVDGKTLVNQDHPQVIEIWNLVFMQFNRMADKSLVPLAQKHIDTGMGFERLAMVLQGVTSNYDTDIFTPIIEAISAKTGVEYTRSDAKKDVAIRVIADHIRAVAFSIADGQLPSNTGSGYVIRRILRRGIRYGYSFLGANEPFIYELTDILVAGMGEAFPELKKQADLIKKVIQQEETSFLKTLMDGIRRFEQHIEQNQGKQTISGEFAFILYDRFGFPIDLTELMADELGWTVDKADFEVRLKGQKDASKEDAATNMDDWVEVHSDQAQVFVGYDQVETKSRITRYRQIVVKKKTMYQLVFDTTPFYAESGGQVGDVGYIEAADGSKTSIIDTKKENNLSVHFCAKLPEDPAGEFRAVVNTTKRTSITNNHTGTHLLHQALREVLGTHVEQKGSLVNADYLRFDFSHFSKVTAEEIQEIEGLVNQRIRENIRLEEFRAIPKDEAMAMGAMALFGEKYGDQVRVIRFGDSVELCGGIHVQGTGQIGMMKIISESSSSAGIRRIEAITGSGAEKFINEQLSLVEHIKDTLKAPKSLTKAVDDLILQNAELNKKVEALIKDKAKGVKAELMSKVREVNEISFLAEQVDLDPGAVKDIAYQLKGQVENLFLVLGTAEGGKPNLTVMISDNLVSERDLNAGTIVRTLAKEIQGGGGGQAFFATAGGKNAAGIPNALKKAEEFLG